MTDTNSNSVDNTAGIHVSYDEGVQAIVLSYIDESISIPVYALPEVMIQMAATALDNKAVPVTDFDNLVDFLIDQAEEA